MKRTFISIMLNFHEDIKTFKWDSLTTKSQENIYCRFYQILFERFSRLNYYDESLRVFFCKEILRNNMMSNVKLYLETEYSLEYWKYDINSEKIEIIFKDVVYVGSVNNRI